MIRINKFLLRNRQIKNKSKLYSFPASFLAFFPASVLASVLFLLFLCVSPAPHAETEYTFGVFPYLPSQQMLKIYGPVSIDLGRKLEAKVQLKTAANFAKFERNLAAEIYDIAVIQPFDYPNAIDKYNYLPVARVNQDLITEFYVRTDSQIRSLQDLKGKRIAFPPIRAANSKMGIAHLYNSGIDPLVDLNITYQKSHESCLQQVWLKKASACVTARPMAELYERKRNVKFKTLSQTAVIPHVLYIVHKRILKNQREKLLQSILSWETDTTGKKLVKSMGFPGFLEAKDQHYEIMRNLSLKKLIHEHPVKANFKDKNVFSLGVFPYFPPRKMAELYGVVPKAFSRVLGGKEVRLKTAKSYKQFGQNIGQYSYDIILIQPFDYFKVAALGYKPIARVSGVLSASIFVKQDSTINSLEQLKGKTMSMPPRTAAVSRLMLAALNSKNLKPGTDIFLEYKETHTSCLRELKFNISDACTTADQILNMLDGDLTANMRQIFTTHSIPHLVLMGAPSLSKEMINDLKEEVINWKNSEKGQSILKQINLPSFVPFMEQDYRSVKTLLLISNIDHE